MADNSRLPLIAGNWKMNCNHLEAIALVQKLAFTLRPNDYQHVEVVVLPPLTALRSVQTLVDGDKMKIRFGAQDLSPFDRGAYTGDVSGPMLAKLGCSYVLCGHSERRQYYYEDDALVNAKVTRRARGFCHAAPVRGGAAGGATRRRAGAARDGAAGRVPGGVPAEAVAAMVIAYEPIWAIGTGEVASPGDAQEMSAAIREWVSATHGPEAAGVRILYGGSVKDDNIAPIMGQQDVDGALVGGASLDAAQFASICRYRELARRQ